MFDSINQRLTDSTFLQQAMKETTKSPDATKKADAAAEPLVIPKESSKAPDEMTEADEKCYETRFGDLQGKHGRQHFQEIGSNQGRLRWCATNLTDYQTQRYIDGNPDLQHAFGRKGKGSRA